MEPRPKYMGYENVDLFFRDRWVNVEDRELVEITKTVTELKLPFYPVDIQYSELINILSNENITPIL